MIKKLKFIFVLCGLQVAIYTYPLAAGHKYEYDTAEYRLLSFSTYLLESPDAIEALIKSAPHHVNLKSDDGFTPLLNAIMANNIAAAQLLIEAKADVNALDDPKGLGSPLHLAIRKGSGTMVALLIQNKADVNAKTVFGQQTPLHLTVDLADHLNDDKVAAQIAELLVQAGADRRAINAKGRIPFQLITKNRYYKYKHLARQLKPTPQGSCLEQLKLESFSEVE